MSYYRGDYYRGDYYRGDPGLFGFLGKAVKAVGGAALKIGGAAIGASPVGQAITAVTRLGAHSPPPAPIPAVPGGLNLQGLPMIQQPGTKVTKGGATAGVSPLGTIGLTFRKRRHMNVANVRALRRALRRAHGFAHLARGVMSFTITGKRGRFSHFKRTRRGRR